MAAPIVSAPVMLAEWKLEPDTGQRLVYRRGSLTPVGGMPDVSGFAELARMFTGNESSRALTSLFAALVLMALAVMAWRWTVPGGDLSVQRPPPRRARCLASWPSRWRSWRFINLGDLAQSQKRSVPRDVTLLAPVQQAGSALTVEVANLADKPSVLSFVALRLARAARAGGVGLWLDHGPAGLEDRWAGSSAGPCSRGRPCVVRMARRSSSPCSPPSCCLQVVIPALRRLWQLPRQPLPDSPPPARAAPRPQ